MGHPNWPVAGAILVNGEVHCFPALNDGEFLKWSSGQLVGAVPAGRKLSSVQVLLTSENRH